MPLQMTRRRSASARRTPMQQSLPFPKRGGPRPGAGRKPGPGRPRLRHTARPKLAQGNPVHVTMRLERGLPSLRSQVVAAAFRTALRRASKEGLRIVHYSLQRDHIHLIVEAPDKKRLSGGMCGLASGFARRVNGLRGTRGRIFADRYHRRDLKSPREVRNALVYVIQNGAKHRVASGVDTFSSAAFFDGWANDANVELARLRAALSPDEPSPVATPRFWLLAVGWKRHGLVSSHERPRRTFSP